jgi:hypothetical protein
LVDRLLRTWIARDVGEEVVRMKHILERDAVAQSRRP